MLKQFCFHKLAVGFKYTCLTFTLYLTIVFNIQHWNYFAFLDSLLDSSTTGTPAATQESKHCWYIIIFNISIY